MTEFNTDFEHVLKSNHALTSAELMDTHLRRMRLKDAFAVLDGLEPDGFPQYTQALADVLRAAREITE